MLTWTGVAEAEGYHIYVNGVRVTDRIITGTEFDLSELGLEIGEHTIQVRAMGEAVGNSFLSNSSRFVVVEVPVGLSVGAVVGIVLGAAAGVLFICAFMIFFVMKKNNKEKAE
jgi:hypothetical protein